MEVRMAKLEQKLDDHIADNLAAAKRNDEASARNDTAHENLFKLVRESMRFQMKLRWFVGISSTIIGAILLMVFHYMPWLWDMVPMHKHVH